MRETSRQYTLTAPIFSLGSARPLLLSCTETVQFLLESFSALSRASSPTPLDRRIILLEELLQRMRKLVSFSGNVQVSVNRFPAQVLQGGQAGGERFDELQRDLLPTGVDVVDTPTASVPFALRHVVMHQLEDTVKVRNRLNIFRVCLQEKRA